MAVAAAVLFTEQGASYLHPRLGIFQSPIRWVEMKCYISDRLRKKGGNKPDQRFPQPHRWHWLGCAKSPERMLRPLSPRL